MAGEKRDLEITLLSISLDAAARPAGVSRHALTAGLLWPRLGTARKIATQTVVLAKGAGAFEALPWRQRILLKESVQGRFGFELALTVALSDAATDAFLAALAGELMKSLAGGLETGAFASGLAALPLSYLAKAVLKEKAPATLAEGGLDLDAAELPAPGERARWRVPLTAPGGVRRVTHRTTGRLHRTVRQVAIPAGGAVGVATVDVLGL